MLSVSSVGWREWSAMLMSLFALSFGSFPVTLELHVDIHTLRLAVNEHGMQIFTSPPFSASGHQQIVTRSPSFQFPSSLSCDCERLQLQRRRRDLGSGDTRIRHRLVGVGCQQLYTGLFIPDRSSQLFREFWSLGVRKVHHQNVSQYVWF